MLRSCVALGFVLLAAVQMVGQAPAPLARPIAVRNDVPRPGTEVLVLRHQQLRKGAHQQYYESSRDGVWPWYERIGTRVVGQWLVTGASPEFDDSYRLARYASFEHWRATRDAENASLGGNGPNREKNVQAGRDRLGVQAGSKGAYFLQGHMAPDGPIHMPGLAESYTLVEAGRPSAVTDEIIAVRNDVAQGGDEIVEIRYQQIVKGGSDRFLSATRAGVWPWEQKLGARPIGQWTVIYPEAPNRTKESPDYDEVVTMTRYASEAHRQAMRRDAAVLMGGNGPDYRAWMAALDLQASLTRETSAELARGHMYLSPPIFMPGLPERYRKAPQ